MWWALLLVPANAFIEDIFAQFAGGAFHHQGFQQPPEPEWPHGITNKIHKRMNWVKGTEWNWNNWRNVKFQKDGSFEAPTQECQHGGCKWSATKSKIYILWGEAGVHELGLDGPLPEDQNLEKLKGVRMRGIRHSDHEKCFATFQRVFDHEAAELDKDLYEVLGLPDDAEDADIKKVYRKLSIKYHPDKNPDEESKRKFADIRDAYEILNDPDKKILYDTGGMEAVKKHEKGEVQKGDDVTSKLSVTLQDLYNGGSHKASIQRRVVCRGCQARPDSPKCSGCSRCPKETRVVHRQIAPGMFVEQREEVNSKEQCKRENTPLDVLIEKGMKDGETVTFPRMAEQKPGQLPGSVIFTLETKKHPKFERRGDDLHMNLKVTLQEALLGWTQKVRHMDGHLLEVGTTSVTRPFQVFKVAGEGMPLRDDPASFGNLFVRVEVIFPTTLTPQQQDAARLLFSQPAPARPEL